MRTKILILVAATAWMQVIPSAARAMAESTTAIKEVEVHTATASVPNTDRSSQALCVDKARDTLLKPIFESFLEAHAEEEGFALKKQAFLSMPIGFQSFPQAAITRFRVIEFSQDKKVYTAKVQASVDIDLLERAWRRVDRTWRIERKPRVIVTVASESSEGRKLAAPIAEQPLRKALEEAGCAVYTEREWQQHTAGLRIAADKVPMPYRLTVSFECWGIKGPAGKPYMTTAEVELVHGHRLPPLHTMDVRVYGAQPQESLEAGGSHLGQQIARDVIADWPGSRTAIDLVSTGLDQEVRKVLKKLQIGTYIQRPQQSSSDSRRWRLEANEMDAEKIVMRLRDSLPESSIEASHRDLITARFVIPPEKKLPQCFLRVSQGTLEDHIRLSKLLQKIPDTKAGHHGLKNGNVTHRITGLTAEQLIEYLSAELPELELSTPQDEVVSASFKAN